MTTFNSVALSTGAFGKKRLELDSVEIRHHNVRGVKLRITKVYRNYATGRDDYSFTETFINLEQAETFQSTIDEFLDGQEEALSFDTISGDTIKIELAVIEERTAKGTDKISGYAITITCPPKHSGAKPFVATTEVNHGTIDLIASYLSAWSERPEDMVKETAEDKVAEALREGDIPKAVASAE